MIPYPANQKRGVENLLKVDKEFRTYGSEELKKEYHKRPSIEAVNSFLKTQYQHGHEQGQRSEECGFLRPFQPIMLDSKQRSRRKPRKTRQSSLTNILQHVISGQASAPARYVY